MLISKLLPFLLKQYKGKEGRTKQLTFKMTACIYNNFSKKYFYQVYNAFIIVKYSFFHIWDLYHMVKRNANKSLSDTELFLHMKFFSRCFLGMKKLNRVVKNVLYVIHFPTGENVSICKTSGFNYFILPFAFCCFIYKGVWQCPVLGKAKVISNAFLDVDYIW